MSLLQMSLAASVMIIAVIILRSLFLNKLPKTTFQALWGLVVLRLVLPFEIPSPLSIYSALSSAQSFIESDAQGGFSASTIAQNAFSMPAVTANSAQAFDFTLAIWLCGTIIAAVFFAVSYRKSIKSFRLAEKLILQAESSVIPKSLRGVQIKKCGKINAPLTYGIFRPVILLPESFDFSDKAALDFVIAHESIHIKRLDGLKKLVLAAAACIHWFNPLVWVMLVLANRDIELSCDEAVVKRFGNDFKSDYAMALIRLEERKSHFSPLISHFSKNAIEERIISVMKLKKTTAAGMIAALALITAAATVFATTAYENEKPVESEKTVEKTDTADENKADDTLSVSTDVPPDGTFSTTTDVPESKNCTTFVTYHDFQDINSQHVAESKLDGAEDITLPEIFVNPVSGSKDEYVFSVDNCETWMSEDEFSALYPEVKINKGSDEIGYFRIIEVTTGSTVNVWSFTDGDALNGQEPPKVVCINGEIVYYTAQTADELAADLAEQVLLGEITSAKADEAVEALKSQITLTENVQ